MEKNKVKDIYLFSDDLLVHGILLPVVPTAVPVLGVPTLLVQTDLKAVRPTRQMVWVVLVLVLTADYGIPVLTRTD